MRLLTLIIICCICSFHIAADDLIYDSGKQAEKTESTDENFDIKDFLFSQTDTLSNAPVLIKHYADKHIIIGYLGSTIEIRPVEYINLYTNELNSYIEFSINGQSCLLTGHDAAAIIKALEHIQSYVNDLPQRYVEGITFDFPVNKMMLSFSVIHKKDKYDWQGMISLSSDELRQYCYFPNIAEKTELLILHLNSCINQVEERIKNPLDRKFIAQYGQQNEPSIFYYEYGKSTQYILNYNFSQTLNGEYSNMLYEQNYDKKLYRALYYIARKSIWSPNNSGRFGALEAYINRTGKIVHSKIHIDSNFLSKISKKNIYKMLDYLEGYKLFPFPSHFDNKVDFVRVYIPLFKCEEELK
jgi:hypothetical protein